MVFNPDGPARLFPEHVVCRRPGRRSDKTQRLLVHADGGGYLDASLSQYEMNEILFICSGNYYRSRFAEAVFNHAAARRSLDWRAFSRGLAIYLVDGDLSPWTEIALRSRGIERSLTGPTRVTLREEDLLRASRAIALKESEHRPMMREQFPAWEDRVEYWSVHDLDFASPEEALPQIEARVLAMVDEFSRRGSDV